MTTTTLAEKIACVRREIGMRERVYPRWVQQGRLTQAKANRAIGNAVVPQIPEIIGRAIMAASDSGDERNG